MSSILQKNSTTSLAIEGGNPLVGDVKISGSKNSALKLIVAALFSNEDVYLDNVPHVGDIESQIAIINALGGCCEWVAPNRLLINGSKISSFEIPLELGIGFRLCTLFAAPLLFRFGKAIIPKLEKNTLGFRPINRWVDTWETLGFEVLDDPHYLILRSGGLEASTIEFKSNTHTGTDNAILSAMFISGSSTILNAAVEPEVDDLIEFCKMIGADISRTDTRMIKVNGKNIFKGGMFTVQPDKDEVVTFITAAIMTNGNITIQGLNREHILSFISVFSKLGCKYEFSGDSIRVWRAGEVLAPVDITTGCAPGFASNWQPMLCLLSTLADGESMIHETVFTQRFNYIKDLNRMGAKIQLFKPSDLDMPIIINDDMYDIQKFGEPFTVARIAGPAKFKASSLDITDLRGGVALLIAALASDSKCTLTNFEILTNGYEDLYIKFENLGAVLDPIS